MMHSFSALRCTAMLACLASSASLAACGSGSSTLTPIGHGATPGASPSAAPSVTAAPSASPTPTPTARPSATPTPTATPTARPSATPAPTATPAVVATASGTSASGVDGSDPADTDVSATAFATFSGNNATINYSFSSTNVTGTATILKASYYLSNPGAFPVTGTAVVAAQASFDDTPADLTFASDQTSILNFQFALFSKADPILSVGSSYTCTIFDGATLVGSASGTVDGTISGGLTSAGVQCSGRYPNTTPPTGGPGYAFVTLPATYHSGDVYTFIVSQ